VFKSSCTRAHRAGSAQGTVPGALPGSTGTIGCFWHQPYALTCHPQRGQPASTARESLPRSSSTRLWPAVMAPRLAGLRAHDAVASHRAADGAVPSIKGARTHAHGTSRGAAARICTFLHRRIDFGQASRALFQCSSLPVYLTVPVESKVMYRKLPTLSDSK
jgi:hypothetical protein